MGTDDAEEQAAVKEVLATPGLVTEVGLDELEEHFDRILAGKVMGRVVVRL